jgi:hypothetical protein
VELLDVALNESCFPLVTPNAGLNAAFFNSPAPAHRPAVFRTA